MSAAMSERQSGAQQVRLRLYLAGDGPNSAKALANLRAALAEIDRSDHVVGVVDVLRGPERGLRDGVLVTPMLVRASPQPERRVLGNLSDRAVLVGVLSPDEVTRGG